LVDSGRSRRSLRQDGNFVVVERPSVHTLDCMFMAAAAMALADGRAEPVEYAGFTRFLRRTELLSRLGRRATAERFATAIERVVSQSATDPVLPQGFRPRANGSGTRLIAQAAVWVAFADGVLHPQERALFNAMLSAFELTHAAFPEGPWPSGTHADTGQSHLPWEADVEIACSRRTDDELLLLLDQTADWTVSGRGGVTLGRLHSLRHALDAVSRYEATGHHVFAICAQPADHIIIFREQMARMAAAAGALADGRLRGDAT
jgi:tellurite resistance protein